MLTATITIQSGQTVTLEGSPSDVGAALAALGGAPSVVKRGPGRPSNASLASAAPVTRKPVSAATARARKLQGQYLGSLRALSVADKKRVQALAKDKGVAAALPLALKLRPKAKA